MSKRQGNPDLMTIEEACALLGCNHAAISDRMARGELRRLRASNGELRLSRAEVEVLAGYVALASDLEYQADASARKSGRSTPRGVALKAGEYVIATTVTARHYADDLHALNG